MRSRIGIAMGVTVLLLAMSIAGERGTAQVRRSRAGDVMEPFTLIDAEGASYARQPRTGRVAVLTFLAGHQKRSERALDDLAALVSQRRRDGHPVDLLIIASGREGIEPLRRMASEHAPGETILLDPDDVLWGRLGVVVTPMTVLVDGEGVIRWIRAGHTFDFATEVHAQLDLALGLAAPGIPPVVDPVSPDPADQSRDPAERARRHLRMGQVLARRGEIDGAIAEVRKAGVLVPGAFTIQAELGRLLCLGAKPEQAIAAADRMQPATPEQHAQVLMLKGWAARQQGDLDQALTLLADSVAQDGGSERALYELGRVLEVRADCRQALEMYRRALETRFGEAAGR